jgi:archaellum biogenesis ATPase FlaH
MLDTIDSADFTETVLKHLIRHPETLKAALEMKMTPDDVLASKESPIMIYRVFAEIALQVKEAPIDQRLFLTLLKDRIREGSLNTGDIAPASQLVQWVYESPLNGAFVLDNLREFVLRKRLAKATSADGKKNAVAIAEAQAKCLIDFETDVTQAKSVVLNPFADLVLKPRYDFVRTGLIEVDAKIGGLGLGEYSLLIGFSGGGKTAMSSFITKNCVVLGQSAVYFSLEEPGENVTNRFYSQQFRIDYSLLHKGKANLELQQAFSAMDPEKRKALTNLRVVDMRDRAPVTRSMIANYLDQLYEQTGFCPQLVVVDQLDYIQPEKDKKEAQQWQVYERASFDMDRLSHHKIGGKYSFHLLVPHQASGKMRKRFTNEQIAGFKGIIKPTDNTFGIGRDDPKASDFAFFSLKTRHNKNFDFEYQGCLEFMTFESISSFGSGGSSQAGNNTGGRQTDMFQHSNPIPLNPQQIFLKESIK